MSNIQTTFALYDVKDYKHDAVLSSYNLPFTPLTFEAVIPSNLSEPINTNKAKVVFDFGDGTQSEKLTSTHLYTLPGEYNVTMIVFDCLNNATLASYSETISIYDYLPNNFTIKYNSLPCNQVELVAGERSKAFYITNTTPFYQTLQDVHYGLSGVGIDNYTDLKTDKFNHLKKYYSFYDRTYINGLGETEFNEIGKFTIRKENQEDIYVKKDTNNNIVRTTKRDPNGFFAGVSGREDFYLVVDSASQSTNFNVIFHKDTNNLYLPDVSGYSNLNYANVVSQTLSCVVEPNTPVAGNVSITSNGLDREGTNEVNTFEINPVQFKCTNIPFLIKPKSQKRFTLKDLTLTEIGISLIDVNNNSYILTEGSDRICEDDCLITEGVYASLTGVELYNHTPSLSYIDGDYFYYGTIKFNADPTEVSSYVMSVTANFTDGVSDFILAGSTDTLTIYPQNYYVLPKHNEDIDFTENLKDLRFQEILIDKNIFFDDFAGSIFGNISSSSESLGKSLYERIFNFVPNTKDIEVCNVDSLISTANMVDEKINAFDQNSLRLPPAIKNSISKTSTRYSRFRGATNTFRENFDAKGRCVPDTYGYNLGDQINTFSYVVTAGTDIVAYEKFSGDYSLLNTFQPVCAISTAEYTYLSPGGDGYLRPGGVDTYLRAISAFSVGQLTYALSGYDSCWGWPLVLPQSFTIDEMEIYYNFYEYNYQEEGSVFDGLIDFDNHQTTLDYNTPLSSFIGVNNVQDVYLKNILFSSLSLFK